MRESVKVIIVVVIMASVITASIAWIDDRPNSTTWLFRTIPIAIAIAAIGVFLRLHWQRDLAPDLLGRQVGGYFERNGFCFQLQPSEVDGKCVFLLFFQNRYENRCTARVAFRPVTFGGAHDTLLCIAVNCPGAAFGVAKRELGLSAKLQGKKVSFDVGADVEYPDGKGRMLRFKDGIVLRRNTSFVDTFARTMTWLALFGGALLFHRPARVKIVVPSNVAEELPSVVPEPAEILWGPGDPLPKPSPLRA